MRFVRIIFYFILIAVIASCQIIEFPEDVKKQPVDDSENTTTSINTKTNEAENTTSDTSVNEINKPVRPDEGFNQDASLALQRDFQFTNFNVRDLSNPFYTVSQFLEAVKKKDLEALQLVTMPDFTYFRKVDQKDTSEFWSYISGIIGLYEGISELTRTENRLSFFLRPTSEASITTVIVLDSSDDKWFVSNVLYVVKTENLQTHGINKYLKGLVIWKGIWDLGAVERFDYEVQTLKTSMFELLRTMFIDARDGFDIKSSDYFLTGEIAENSSSAIIQSSAKEQDSKLNENNFMINFYKSYKMTNLLCVSNFPLSENILIETYAVFFDTKINPIVFISWIIIDGIPFVERIELPTGSSLQIFFDD